MECISPYRYFQLNSYIFASHCCVVFKCILTILPLFCPFPLCFLLVRILYILLISMTSFHLVGISSDAEGCLAASSNQQLLEHQQASTEHHQCCLTVVHKKNANNMKHRKNDKRKSTGKNRSKY